MGKKVRRPVLECGPQVVIPLTRGLFAWASKKDLPLIAGFNWHALSNSRGVVYAARRPGKGEGIGSVELMHRRVLGLKKGDPLEGDHINGDTLDNTRGNLRKATDAETARNRGPMARRRVRPGSSIGVAYHFESRHVKKPWRAYLRVKGKQQHLGYFSTEVEASEVRENAARAAFGEFYRAAA